MSIYVFIVCPIKRSKISFISPCCHTETICVITRLQVDGFKNLVDVDIHFGKFNVVTGPNGIGKSNLFDAIQLIRAVSGNSILQGILSIRGTENEPRNLFGKVAESAQRCAAFQVDFELEADKVSYSFILGCDATKENIEFSDEKLCLSDGRVALEKANKLTIPYHQRSDTWDFARLMANSGTELYKKAMDGDDSSLSTQAIIGIYNWLLVDLEMGNIYTSHVGEVVDYNLSTFELPLIMKEIIDRRSGGSDDLFNRLSNRLFQLTGELLKFRLVEPPHSLNDSRQKTMSLEFAKIGSEWLPASLLSDGTLRFLALILIELDPGRRGVFCIEEPENGIHPSKLPALLRLLRDISEKPGCQVIVNTHSPALVAQTPAEDIIVAYPVQRADPDGTYYTIPRFAGLKDTWRQEAGMHVATISQVLDFLDPVPQRYSDDPKRLLDRDDARRLVERRRKFTWEETED